MSEDVCRICEEDEFESEPYDEAVGTVDIECTEVPVCWHHRELLEKVSELPVPNSGLNSTTEGDSAE